MDKAFVLSGGSIRGAFQAGAIAEILTSGSFVPDAVYGTSVGSLNGAFIADRAGQAVAAGELPDWVGIGNELQNFWLQEITSFDKIAKKRGALGLLGSLLFNKFDGFIDTSPLCDLVKREIKIENLLSSPVKFYACSVNAVTGEPVYASADDYPNIHDYIIASTAIPIVMPLRVIATEPYVDGGIREVAPLAQAIKDGASEIFCILCQTKDMQKKEFNYKNVIELMDRLMDIVTNETVTNDIEQCIEINELIEQIQQPITYGPLAEKRHIDLNIIRPSVPVDIDLETFDAVQIRKALKAGWDASQEVRNTTMVTA